jgi:hypothetical protein
LPPSSGLKSQSNKKPAEAGGKLSLQYVPLKHWALSKLHCITIQKTVLFTNSIWNKEDLPQQWKESIIVLIYKNGDKTDCNNTTACDYYKIHTKCYPNITLSRLTSYADDIIADHQR